MDKINNNIVNNMQKKTLRVHKLPNDRSKTESADNVLSSNVVDIKDTKKIVKDMAKKCQLIQIRLQKKRSLSTGKYPLDLTNYLTH